MNSVIQTVSLVVSLISLVTTVVVVTIFMTRIKVNQEHQDKAIADYSKREDATTKEVTEFFSLLKQFIAQQTEVNKGNLVALDSITKKLEQLEARVTSMDKSVIESSAIVALLTEFIKQSKKMNLE